MRVLFYLILLLLKIWYVIFIDTQICYIFINLFACLHPLSYQEGTSS